MSLEKRDGSPFWQIRFEFAGRTYRKSSKTADRRLAKKIEDEFYEQVVRQHALGEGGVAVSYDDAVGRWEREKSHKRSLARDRIISRYFRELVGGDTPVASLDENAVAALRSATLEEFERKGRKPATSNRYIAWLQSFLRFLHGERLVGFRAVVPKLRLAAKDYDLRNPAVIEGVLAALPPSQQAIARFALATGQRRGNVLRLRWEHVDVAGKRFLIPGSTHKSGKAKQVPLSGDAVVILEQQRGKHPEYVFTDHRGHAPVGSVKKAWASACAKAGVTGLRFHDLRHHWASWHVQNGTPLMVVKELGGWASVQMLDKVYGHLAPSHLAAWADNTKAKGEA
jgi:integrase